MSTRSLTVPERMLEEIIAVVCENTGLAIALVELKENAQGLIPSASRDNFSTFCKTLSSIETTAVRCRADHMARARACTSQNVRLCHAGLANVSIPIRIDGIVKAVLMCGQFLPDDEATAALANQTFGRFLDDIASAASTDDVKKLRRTLASSYGSASRGSASHIRELTTQLTRVSEWIYWADHSLRETASRNENIRKRRDEALETARRVLHDMAHPLQSLLSLAEMAHEHATDGRHGTRAARRAFVTFNTELLVAVRELHEVDSMFKKNVIRPEENRSYPLQAQADNEVIAGLLDAFRQSTHLAIGLFELAGNGREVVPPDNQSSFSPFCRHVWKFGGGRQACDNDHRTRARTQRTEGPSLCHCGLVNYAIPIEVDGSIAAVLLCGQRRPQSDSIADQRRRDTVARVTAFQPQRLRRHVESLLSGAYAAVQSEYELLRNTERLRRLARLIGWMYNTHLQLDMAAVEHDKIADSLRSIINAQRSLHHDIVSLGLQAIVDKVSHLQDVARRTPHSLASEMGFRFREILDTLDWTRHRLFSSVPAQFAAGSDKPAICDLSEIVSRCIAELSGSAERWNVHFQLVSELQYPYFCNGIEFHTALWNLFQNAVKYSYSGYRTVSGRTIRVGMSSVPNGLRIWIENYGVGILPSESDLIYKVGQRGILAKKERPDGLGLGLPEAAALLERNGCRVSHRCKQLGQERYVTTFFVDVPINEDGGSDADHLD